MTSNFIQIAPYLLLEYMYGDNSTTYTADQTGLYKIINGHSGQNGLINGNVATDLTLNSFNNSLIQIDASRYASLSENLPVPYVNYDSQIQIQDKVSQFTGVNLKYDTIRIHIQSGFQLDGIDGLLIHAGIRENSGNYFELSNRLFSKGLEEVTLRSTPIMLGDRSYDRYFDTLIPNSSDLVNSWVLDPTSINIGRLFTTDERGFNVSTSVYITAGELSSNTDVNGFEIYTLNKKYEVTVALSDIYGDVVANVYESQEGDFIEYYPTYNGDFIQDYIFELSRNGNYVLVHELSVYEQVGVDFLLTGSFSQMQESGFDQPLYFRPILKHADVAVSFSIDYFVKLYNTSNGFSVMRMASLTSFNVKKYGKTLEKINIDATSPFKIYNKVVGGTTIQLPNVSSIEKPGIAIVPVFIDKQNIVLQNKSTLQSGTTSVNGNINAENFLFGQGDCRIYLSDFNDYIQFKISQIDQNDIITPIDLSKTILNLVFNDKTGNKIQIPLFSGDSASELSKGLAVFKIPDNMNHVLFFDSTTTVIPFYITSISGGSTTLLYSGTADKIENISKEIDRLNGLKNKVAITQPSGTATSNNDSSSQVSSNTADKNFRVPTGLPGAGSNNGSSIKTGMAPNS